MNLHGVILEVATDSVEGAIVAEAGGAGRVELCSGLFEGGTTPSLGAIEHAVQRTTIPVFVLVRPRGGDFCYTPIELDVLRRDIEHARTLGARGIVLGCLRPEGTIDAAATRDLIARARPLPVTFHRAFDMTRDAFEALEALVDLGVERVLTSGQEKTALEGLDRIRELVERAAGRIGVVPAGGVTELNAARIVRASGVVEVHASLRSLVESPMQHRNGRAFLGGELRPDEYARGATDGKRVRALLASLGNAGASAAP
ncbi:MAG TPA: copper homeostasis protein CutC [Planctomycetota bacterium]|nr:copper homeostasis protein CutC [Planctomycetota bacterium]